MQLRNALNVGTDFQKFQNVYFDIFADSPNEVFLLMFFIKKFNEFNFYNMLKDNGSFYLSLQKIRSECFKDNLSKPTIIKLIDNLIEKGFISKEICMDSNYANYYLLNFDYINSLVGKQEKVMACEYVQEDYEPNQTLPAVKTVSYGKKIMVSWNAIAEKYGLAKINQCKEDRIKRFKNILKLVEKNEHDLFVGIDEAIKNSNFLKGKTGWKCSFDFFLQKSSIQKALEGQYNDMDTPIVNTTKADIKQKEFEQMANSFLSNDKDVIIY